LPPLTAAEEKELKDDLDAYSEFCSRMLAGGKLGMAFGELVSRVAGIW
jgi:hypothetical protein